MLYFRKIVLLLLIAATAAIGQNKLTLKVEHKTKDLPFGLKHEISTLIPKTTLVLSGGGSRGFSQIGVLKALEENNIPVDLIVGTSMGSIVGGLYASGFSVDQIDSIAVYSDWDRLLASQRQTDRTDLFVDQKITEDKAVIALRLKGLKPVIPTSISTGQKLSNFLNLLTLQAPIHTKNSFDKLKIPFRAVGTNLVTGESVIISEGSLSQALRGSASVSFYLSPIRIDSLIIVDGGLTANIPAEIASNISNEYVMAVNTTSELHSEEDLNYPWIVADQIVSIPMKLLNERQLRFADVVIEPELLGKTSNDFSNIDSIIAIGYEAALKKIDTIKTSLNNIVNLRLPAEEYYLKNITYPSYATKFEENFLKKYKNLDSVSTNQILKDLNTVYETGYYKELSAEVTTITDKVSLRLIPLYNPLVQSINVIGVSKLQESNVNQILNELKYKPFNSKLLSDKLINILQLYRSEGYSLADIESIRFSEETGAIELYFDEGIIDEIKIDGNSYTEDNIILRELHFSKGEVYKHFDIEKGLTNLRSSNLFDDVYFSVVEEGGKNIILIRVYERITSLLRLGFRIDNEKNAQFNVDIRDENLFGRGSEIGFNILGGSRNRGYILELKSNRILNTYLTYKFNVFYKFDDAFNYTHFLTPDNKRYKSSNVGEYRQIYYGASFALGAQVERFGNIIFAASYQWDQLKTKWGTTYEPYKIKLLTLKASSTLDTQDKYPFPTRGLYFNGTYETAQNVLGGSLGYINIWFNYKSFFTFNSLHTISPKIVMGFGDKTLPVTQQFSLGGQGEFFGLLENEFRGRQKFLSSLEYRIKSPLDLFFDTYVKVRYDLGSTWETQERIRFKDLKHGVGGTLSFDTPVGPAEFSVGKAFYLQRNLPNRFTWGETRFYFSIGYYY